MKAKYKAKQMQGFGPMLYMANELEWQHYLGGHLSGSCVYALLLSVRHSEGAVPPNIVIDHGEKKTL